VEIIIEKLKVPKCMMLRDIKYLDSEDIDILVLLKTYQVLKMYLKNKFQQLLKNLKIKSEKLLINNISEIHKL
jgi:hypothetical protein